VLLKNNNKSNPQATKEAAETKTTTATSNRTYIQASKSTRDKEQ
jgi:hypothetical protein